MVLFSDFHAVHPRHGSHREDSNREDSHVTLDLDPQIDPLSYPPSNADLASDPLKKFYYYSATVTLDDTGSRRIRIYSVHARGLQQSQNVFETGIVALLETHPTST